MSEALEIAPSVERLQFELYCRDIAVRLSAYQLLEFMADDNGMPQPYIWSGNSFIDASPDEDDNWTRIEWSEMPLIAELYERFGEPGIYFWPAYNTETPLPETSPEVQEIYRDAVAFLIEYANRDNPRPQTH